MAKTINDLDDAQDRAAGALMGAFVGEALGVGPHWFYDLAEQRKHYGDWIDTYTRSLPGRYHENLLPGELSQAGLILKLTAQSLVEHSGYFRDDFCRNFEAEIFEKIDGSPMAGPGGYTSQSIREAFFRWRDANKDWTDLAGPADTTEALERTLAMGAFYAFDLKQMAQKVIENALLTQNDATVLSLTVAFNAVVALLIQGERLDGDISRKLMALVKSGELPFHTVTSDNYAPPTKNNTGQSQADVFPSPDALLSPAYMARAAVDTDIVIAPAWKVSLVYGMPCAIYHQLPAAYYLAARFGDDFECGVLHAINGGGQNQVRAMLTGALIGAQSGLTKIPQRFVDGLTDKAELLSLVTKLASQIHATR